MNCGFEYFIKYLVKQMKKHKKLWFNNSAGSCQPARGVELVKPQAIEQYNSYIGVVDKYDSTSPIMASATEHTAKWFWIFFSHLLDVAVVNDQVLYHQSQQVETKLPP